MEIVGGRNYEKIIISSYDDRIISSLWGKSTIYKYKK